MPETNSCRICGNNSNNKQYTVREMLHGTREIFDYFQCSNCGCLQIAEVPADLARHYPSDYQAYKSYQRRSRNSLRRFFDSRRVHHAFTGKGLIGYLVTRTAPALDYLGWCKFMQISQEKRVLDVGCGNGKLLTRMMAGGYTHLRGIDPFIDSNLIFGPEALIYKTSLPEYATNSMEKYDLVMLHHSFEHIDNPRDVLHWCSQLMKEDGWLLIRIPLADSYAWEKYREHWFALDAPRHLYLHTRKSIRLLAEQTGFIVVREERDSSITQFTNSELYLRDIPANAPREQRDIFPQAQLKAFTELAKKLNMEGRGDQGVFYLRKITTDGAQ